MRTVEGVVGNVRDDDLLADAREGHAEAGTLERVEIDAADRVKSRFRATTDGGTELGVVADRPQLRDGDVLVAEDDLFVVLRFASREAVAVDLPDGGSSATLLELGHRIGNQHWDLAVRDGTAYVPLDADRRIVEDVLEGTLPADAELRVETVDGGLFVEDGARGADHGHGDDHEHAGHGHRHDAGGQDHGHEAGSHDHGREHGDHSHEHDHSGHSHEHEHGDHNHQHGGGRE